MAEHDEIAERRRDREDKVLVAITQLKTEVAAMNAQGIAKFASHNKWLYEHEVKLDAHEKEITKTKTLFGVISWASGAAWTGLLAWMGWTHK